jgi:thioredoxin 1
MIKEITDSKEFEEAVKGKKVLVDFYATWCGPCSMIAPIVEKVAKDHPELDVVRVDVDKAPRIAAAYRVSAIPTLYYFEDGSAVRDLVGYAPEERILDLCSLG